MSTKVANPPARTKLSPAIAKKFARAEETYNVLCSAQFNKWYTDGAFNHHLCGDLPPIPKEVIISAIVLIFDKVV